MKFPKPRNLLKNEFPDLTVVQPAGAEECGVREDRARLSGIYRPSLHERGEQPTEGVRPVDQTSRDRASDPFPRVGLLERAPVWSWQRYRWTSCHARGRIVFGLRPALGNLAVWPKAPFGSPDHSPGRVGVPNRL
jgi:hypothetical protein